MSTQLQTMRMNLMAEIYDHVLITEALVMELYKQNGLAKSEIADLIEKFATIRDAATQVKKSYLHNLDIIYEGTASQFDKKIEGTT